MTTNTKELGLEALIVAHLRDVNGYVEGKSELYSKDEAIVKSWLEAFLVATQPEKVARSMCFASASEKAKFYSRLCEALAKRGVTDVLRKGFAFNGTMFDLYFPLPSEQNPSAKEAYEKNCFGVIRQLHDSKIDAKRRPLSEPQLIAVGTVNGVGIHPRDVFSIAVRWNAHSIVVAHNHPSGSSLPSKRDVDLTWGLYGAGKMMGIALVDHIIITGKSHYSFADNGRLCNQE